MLNIFVSHASDSLTDHLPHGEGLLCFTWLKSLAERGHKIYAFSPGADIKQKVANLTIFRSDKKFSLPSLSYWHYAKESSQILKNTLKYNNIDLVWRMYPYGISIPFIKTFGKPLVIGPLYSTYGRDNITTNISFGLRPSQFGSFFANKGWNKIINKTDVFFTDSLKTVIELKELFPDKIICQLPAIISPTFEVKERKIPNFQNEVKIVFVGHFHPSKRLPDFCRIIYIIRKSGWNIHGYVVGEGEDFKKAADYCEKMRINNFVHFKGRISNKEIFNLLAEMHINITLRPETYGRAIVEAMSVGTPNICVNKLAVTEFIEQGVSGILLDDISCESYVSAILGIINNPTKWKKISDNSIKKSKEWDSENITKIIENTFYSVLKNKNK